MSVAEAKIKRRYSPEEYLELEREARARHEFLDGVIYAMAGESLSHTRICANLARDVAVALKGGPCENFSPNMKNERWGNCCCPRMRDEALNPGEGARRHVSVQRRASFRYWQRPAGAT